MFSKTLTIGIPCLVLVALVPVLSLQANEPDGAPVPVVVEGARLPAGTRVEPLGDAVLSRLGGSHAARRYRCTAAPGRFQTSCSYVGGTSEVKTARWELAVFDDPGGEAYARLTGVLMRLRDQRNAEWRARWGTPRKDWEEPPDTLPPLVLCSGPGKSPLVVIYADGRFWEWTFQGFLEGGGAFGNGHLPEAVLYGDGAGVTAGFRQGFSAMADEFRPFYLTAP